MIYMIYVGVAENLVYPSSIPWFSCLMGKMDDHWILGSPISRQSHASDSTKVPKQRATGQQRPRPGCNRPIEVVKNGQNKLCDVYKMYISHTYL